METTMMKKLWYKTPPTEWKHGLLIGNGRLAGTVFGDGHGERLGLNHELLYGGKYKDRECNPESVKYLQEIRDHLMAERYLEGTVLANETYGGCGGIALNTKGPAHIDSYKPAGELVIIPEIIENRDYYRSLDLETAMALVSYDGVTYEYVADSVHNKILVHITGKLKAKLALEFQPDESLRLEVLCDDKHIRAVGCYDNCVYFETRVSVFTDGSFDGSCLTVLKEATLVIDIETGLDCAEEVANRLDQRYLVPETDFHRMIQSHIEKYHEVMDRLVLELDEESGEDIPTDQRIQIYRNGGTDLTLLKTYFDFGHYLLYSGSVCGTMPLHLQGKWNNLLNPPWNSDYHNNINTQMNYWPAEMLGMGDAHLTLFNYLERIVPNARKAAKRLYNCRGIYMTQTDDIWCRCTPESTGWDVWVGAAPWLAEHFYRHYQFTGDLEFLKNRAYPFMKETCEFFEDYLIPDEQGVLQVVPSQSPENYFEMGQTSYLPVSLCPSCAMDLSLIREVMTNSIEAASRLDVDPEKIELWKSILNRLQPLTIGKDGRLIEWDKEHLELEPGHRHMSHLYGVFPGGFITERDTPELFEAAIKSYDYRLANDGGYTGWSRSWCANLDARFGRGDAAFEQVKELIREFSSDSLLDLHPPKIFQIDGNFGGISGILEMLVRVSGERVKLLPALPSELKNGSIRGVRLPGGAVCDMVWKNGKLADCKITLGISGKLLLEGDVQVQGGNVTKIDDFVKITAPAGTVITVTE